MGQQIHLDLLEVIWVARQKEKKLKKEGAFFLPHILKAFKAFSLKGDFLLALGNVGSCFP